MNVLRKLSFGLLWLAVACFVLSSNLQASPAQVPKLLHSVWLGEPIPAVQLAHLKVWLEANPDLK
ncbi:hypothetical protein, partial [Solemya velesiana gill symbiont]|uniref:hypothetical protein n=1 Tax=Solemya velesiana gill symbiont TaxID=1918948 RepID=UPI001C12BD90